MRADETLVAQVAEPAGSQVSNLAGAPVAKTLVLGLGNDILTDDAIGLAIVREVARCLDGDPRVDVRETMEMGLALLDFIVGYETLILVDSIQTGRAAPGHIHDLTQAHLAAQPGRTPHFLGVKDTLLLGERLGLEMPRHVRVFAIEAEDPFTLGTELTPALRRTLPLAVGRVLSAITRAPLEPSPAPGRDPQPAAVPA
jgi:hydrogenase maturation protease